jgi:hypothetical protein
MGHGGRCVPIPLLLPAVSRQALCSSHLTHGQRCLWLFIVIAVTRRCSGLRGDMTSMRCMCGWMAVCSWLLLTLCSAQSSSSSSSAAVSSSSSAAQAAVSSSSSAAQAAWSSSSSAAAVSPSSVFFAAAVLRGSYLMPRALGYITFAQTQPGAKTTIQLSIDGLPDGVSRQRHSAARSTALAPTVAANADSWRFGVVSAVRPARA